MRIHVFLQARIGSTRLPNKIMLPLEDKLVLEHDIERIRRSRKITNLVVCTTTGEKENAITRLCNKLGVDYYRGDEHDVLDRYYQAAVHYKPDIIVRITSDCPMSDPNIIDDMINNYLQIKEEQAREKDPTFRNNSFLDVNDRPRFVFKQESLLNRFGAGLPYLGLLLFFNVLFFVMAFVRFLRYDVR